MNHDLHAYLQAHILPQYDAFADGHDRSHVEMVLRECLYLARAHGVDEDMAYAAAAYHDLGVPQGRETHHLTSAALFAADDNMRAWFSPEQLTTIRQAIEDHRASAAAPPRSLLGRVLADADHFIVPEVIVRRTMLYRKAHFPHLAPQQMIESAREHMREKFCENGYLRFWLNDPRSLQGLRDLRDLVADDARFTALCASFL